METVILEESIYEEIIRHSRSEYPKEACGLLTGIASKDTIFISKLFKMRNVFETPEIGYFMDPKELFEVFKKIRDLELKFLAIYHSHPLTPVRPSKKDIEIAYYPEAVYIIISLVDFNNPEVKGFKIIEGKVTKLNLMKKVL